MYFILVQISAEENNNKIKVNRFSARAKKSATVGFKYVLIKSEVALCGALPEK